MREFTVYAPAKLNLYLDVLEKRRDGYHNIKTLFEKVDLKDEIVVREKGRGVDVRVEPATCPSGKDNIVFKAIQALFKDVDIKLDLDIVIRKKIPVSAGMGGGSSDAASILRSINETFELDLPFKRLFSLAVEIGKDVPFFMIDAPFCKATGAGEVLEALDAKFTLSHVVVTPDIAISTGEMYKRLDGDKYKSERRGSIEKTVSAICKKDVFLLRDNYYNRFEEVLFDYRGVIDKAKILLQKAGAGPVFLSGSGPSVFCTFKEREEAKKILQKIPKVKGFDTFLATTYKGGIYGDN